MDGARRPSAPARSRPRTRILRGLLLSCAVSALLLCSVEWGLRWAGFARVPGRYFDPTIGYRFQPNQVREVIGVDGRSSLPVRFNQLGYRGPAPHRAGAFDGLRIACLGDSFTFGWGVADGEEYPLQLYAELRNRLAQGSFEVSNFAVPGYNVWNSLQTYRQVVRGFGPDVVVFGFLANDLEPKIEGAVYTGRPFVRRIVHTALFDAFHRYLRPHTPLSSSSGSEESRAFRRNYFAHQLALEDQPDSELARPYWSALLADLGELVEEVRADGAELLVILFPLARQLNALGSAAQGTDREQALAQASIPQRHLARELERLGVPFVDLLETFEGAGPRIYSELRPGHPGADALRATAARIAREFEERGWLTRERPAAIPGAGRGAGARR